MRFSLLLLTCLAATRPALAEPPQTIADIAPVHGLVAAVMGDLHTPDLLIPLGADPHHHALKPSDARALSEAELIFSAGAALNPWLEKGFESLAPNAQVFDLNATPDGITLPARGDDEEHDDHGDHNDHDNHDDHDDHGKHDEHDEHDHGDIDPHGWLDPQNAIVWLDVIAQELSRADPANAAQYLENATQTKTKLNEVIQQISNDLAPLNTKSYLASHDSYQYFESRFGLTLTAAIALSDAAAPGPAKLAHIRKTAEETNSTCLALDIHINPDLVATVTQDRDLQPVVIDPMGAKLTLGPDFYPALIQATAQAFVTCLGGPS